MKHQNAKRSWWQQAPARSAWIHLNYWLKHPGEHFSICSLAPNEAGCFIRGQRSEVSGLSFADVLLWLFTLFPLKGTMIQIPLVSRHFRVIFYILVKDCCEEMCCRMEGSGFESWTGLVLHLVWMFCQSECIVVRGVHTSWKGLHLKLQPKNVLNLYKLALNTLIKTVYFHILYFLFLSEHFSTFLCHVSNLCVWTQNFTCTNVACCPTGGEQATVVTLFTFHRKNRSVLSVLSHF